MMVESFLNSFGDLFPNASKSSTFFVLFAIYATIQDQFQISPVYQKLGKSKLSTVPEIGKLKLSTVPKFYSTKLGS